MIDTATKMRLAVSEIEIEIVRIFGEWGKIAVNMAEINEHLNLNDNIIDRIKNDMVNALQEIRAKI